MKRFYLILLLTACSSAEVRTPAAATVLGGGHGGGGNLLLSYPATDDELKTAVEFLPDMLWKALSFQEMLTDPNLLNSFGQRLVYVPPGGAPARKVEVDQRVLARAYAKLFPSRGSDVFAELERVHFKLKPAGPCEDRDFNHKDASAFNDDPTEICFSAERLKQSMHSDTLGTDFLALGAHEITHRMGGNEEEALAVQLAVLLNSDRRDVVGLNDNMKFSDDKLVSAYGKSISDNRWMEDLDNALGDYNPKSRGTLADLCVQLANQQAFTNSQIDHVIRDVEHGFSHVRLRGMRALVAADIQASAAVGFCKNVKRTCCERNSTAFYYGRTFHPLDTYDLAEEGEIDAPIRDKGYLMMWGFALNLEELKFNCAQVKKSLSVYRKYHRN